MSGSVCTSGRRRAGRIKIVANLLRVALACSAAIVWLTPAIARAADKVTLEGSIVDAETGKPVAARLYIQAADGQWHTAKSADPKGEAIAYRIQRGTRSIEVHTSLSAHPFAAELEPGQYVLTVERGKEYLPSRQMVAVTAKQQSVEFKLKRWIDMSKYGWYSGETHVHRTLADLPTAMLAEDMNVAFPLTHWVTKSDTLPGRGDKNQPPVRPQLITVDPTHVIYPFNTEYEIFTVGGKSHTLGAVFAINHKQDLAYGVPPVRPVAEQVHREGGLLELDKHNWPWSMMLVPVMKVDLYELANNHHWRTEFLFRDFGETVPEYMGIAKRDGGMTEADWTEFGWQNYYALLNCGYRLRPTAGSASGVHPVPLGFGRVYVHLPDGFSYDAWLAGLNAGRSFVTTGPMLFANVNDATPGATLKQTKTRESFRVWGMALSQQPLSTLEIVSAGEVVKSIKPVNKPRDKGGFESPFDVEVDNIRSTWIAVRCREPDGEAKFRFAHTAPLYIDMERRPLRPRKVEVEYLVDRVESQLKRNEGVLPAAALDEYREAATKYRELLPTAR
ncbi:MAG TPA: CehA/McbA family metallohydrolase [Pirellulaceae bacterium]|nr:CehA/McbA family metallohydrolase [Pirellulaceae bacterium]